MNQDPVVIVGAARTPMGALQGELKDFAAPELGAVAIRAAVERAGVKPEDVEEVIMGCVLPAGQGQAPARQAALGAGLPLATGCTTVNKMCGSGMKAAMLANDLLLAGTNKIMVAGGMESMTNAPYLLPKARAGYRMGHQQVVDHMFLDGLEDAYDKGRLMGSFAEECAAKYSFTRSEQDAFAVKSLQRAQKANDEGWFAWEIAHVALKSGKGDRFVDKDEQPFKANFEKIPQLKPAFKKDGTVTAANSSSISDGAAALVLMRAVRGAAARAHAACAHRRAHHPCAGAGLVHHRTGRRDSQALRQDRLEAGGRGPVRDQRGFRGGDDGGDEGARPAARQGQRARRRVRAGPSHRRLRRAHPRHAARRAAQVRAEARRRGAVHRRAARPRPWRLSQSRTTGGAGADGMQSTLCDACILEYVRACIGTLMRAVSMLNRPMTERKLISSGSTFEKIAGYSRAVVDGDWVFVSGTTGYDYSKMTISPDVEAQARQVFANISAALAQAGCSLEDVVRVHYYLTDRSDFDRLAPIFGEYFGTARPAATALVCALVSADDEDRDRGHRAKKRRRAQCPRRAGELPAGPRVRGRSCQPWISTTTSHLPTGISPPTRSAPSRRSTVAA